MPQFKSKVLEGIQILSLVTQNLIMIYRDRTSFPAILSRILGAHPLTLRP